MDKNKTVKKERTKKKERKIRRKFGNFNFMPALN